MFRIAVLAVVAAVTLTACASAPLTGASAAIEPLENFYDVAWVRSSDGSITTLEEVAGELSDYDVVFFGEHHGHPGIHLAQMRMFQALHGHSPEMSLSLEQFERDTQPLVDQYLAGEIGEEVLQEDARAWPNYESSYRPLVEYAVDHGLPVVAANAPKSIVICVSKKGPGILDEIPQPDRGWAAEEIHADEGPYLDKYLRVMGDVSRHAGGGAAEEGEEEAAAELSPQMRAMVMRSFAAQVTRDDTMAESIVRHLRDNPHRKVLHLDGNFHSASHLGTVERVKMRMPELKLAVINPIAVEDNDAPAWTEEDGATGDYILLVQDMPTAFVSEEKEMEFQMKIMKKRSANTCEYGAEPEKEGSQK